MKRTSRRPRRNPSPLDNPAFRRWFGDSKVVDDRGEPLVVWHASSADADSFDEFDLDLAFDMGVHFGTYEAASAFSGEPRSYFLKIERPLRLVDPLDWIGETADSTLDQLLKLGLISRSVHGSMSETIADRKAALGIRWTGHEEWLKTSDNKQEKQWVRFRADAGKQIAALIRKAGYDGVVYDNAVERGESYMVFEPTQIKAAVGNRGTFDPNDPNVFHGIARRR